MRGFMPAGSFGARGLKEFLKRPAVTKQVANAGGPKNLPSGLPQGSTHRRNAGRRSP